MDPFLEVFLRWLVASVAATETVLLVLAITAIIYGIAFSHVPNNTETPDV